MWAGVCRYKRHHTEAIVVLYLPRDAKAVLQKIGKANAEYMHVELRKPAKPRTTGMDSQNHAINGFCQQIAFATGQEFDTVKLAMKYQALTRLYPFDTETLTGRAIPWSERRLNTDQAAILIETIHQFAAENGIVLRR